MMVDGWVDGLWIDGWMEDGTFPDVFRGHTYTCTKRDMR